MNLKKLVTAAVCTMLMAAVAFTAGCGGEKKSDKKVLKVGMECAYAPYNWSQTKVDAAIAGMSITSKRKETVDFTKPYYYATVVALVKKDSEQAKAQSVADLKGSVATSQLNTIWYDQIDQVPDVKKLPAIDTVPGMIVALTSGKCNLIVTDIPTAKAAAFANPELTVLNFEEGKGFKTSREDVEIGIAVKKGNTELVKAMDAVLEKMTAADFDKMMDEAIKKQPLAQ